MPIGYINLPQLISQELIFDQVKLQSHISKHANYRFNIFPSYSMSKQDQQNWNHIFSIFET